MSLIKPHRTDFKHLSHTFKHIEATTLESGRTYHTPVGDLPSITTVLGCDPEKEIILDKWRDRIGHAQAIKETEAAAKRGNEVHQLAEDYVNNKPLIYETALSERLFKTIRPIINRIDNVMAQEACLYSKVLNVAGRVDCIAEYNGVMSIIDYKTSKKEKKKEWITSYFTQCTAYSFMITEMLGISIDQIVIIIANENTPIGSVFVDSRENYKDELIKSIKIYREQQK